VHHATFDVHRTGCAYDDAACDRPLAVEHQPTQRHHGVGLVDVNVGAEIDGVAVAGDRQRFVDRGIVAVGSGVEDLDLAAGLCDLNGPLQRAARLRLRARVGVVAGDADVACCRPPGPPDE
jgi:hypothetical protein